VSDYFSHIITETFLTSLVILHVLNLKISHMTFLTHRRHLCEKKTY